MQLKEPMEISKMGDAEAKTNFKPQWVWVSVAVFTFLHLNFLIGWYMMLTGQPKWQTTLFGCFFWALFAGQGVTMGVHRLWAHRSFKATLPLKIILLIAQTQAGQNSVLVWVRDHRLHHKYSDTDADPHNSNRGFFFSHMGWLMMKKHPEVIAKGKSLDISDLKADPLIMFQYKYFLQLYTVFGILVPFSFSYFLIGDTFWNSLMVGYFTRYSVILHSTWCVNSVAHFFGTKPYNKDIRPVETGFVSFITSGEGWHNYHHTFPFDYQAGEFGRRLNGTRSIIEFCARIGLAYNLRTVTPEMVAHRISKYGDGSHHTKAAAPMEELEVDDEGNKYVKRVRFDQAVRA